jgi:hypothetical protein
MSFIFKDKVHVILISCMESEMEMVEPLWQNVVSTSQNIKIQNKTYWKPQTDNNSASEFNSNTVVNPQVGNKISSEENWFCIQWYTKKSS